MTDSGRHERRDYQGYWNTGMVVTVLLTLTGVVGYMALQNPWQSLAVAAIAATAAVLPYIVGRVTVWVWGVVDG